MFFMYSVPQLSFLHWASHKDSMISIVALQVPCIYSGNIFASCKAFDRPLKNVHSEVLSVRKSTSCDAIYQCSCRVTRSKKSANSTTKLGTTSDKPSSSYLMIVGTSAARLGKPFSWQITSYGLSSRSDGCLP